MAKKGMVLIECLPNRCTKYKGIFKNNMDLPFEVDLDFAKDVVKAGLCKIVLSEAEADAKVKAENKAKAEAEVEANAKAKAEIRAEMEAEIRAEMEAEKVDTTTRRSKGKNSNG